MEHRYSQRFKSNSQVLIYERSMPVSTGRAINSSRYGFFVETNHSVMNNQPLEIEIIDRQSRSANRSQQRRMKCFVVHAQNNGFGVEVHEDHINEFGAIAAMRFLVGEKVSGERVSGEKFSSEKVAGTHIANQQEPPRKLAGRL